LTVRVAGRYNWLFRLSIVNAPNTSPGISRSAAPFDSALNQVERSGGVRSSAKEIEAQGRKLEIGIQEKS
jgi:hypothetical protein